MKLSDWWADIGTDPVTKDNTLRKYAIKILGLTFFASECKRNWSTFQQLNSVKWNMLPEKKANDLDI